MSVPQDGGPDGEPQRNSSSEEGELVTRLFCENKGDGTWTVALGPGYCPAQLRPFFDENFETPRLVLDFGRLQELLGQSSATCEKSVSTLGDVTLTARGDGAKALAAWLGSSLTSSGLPAPEL